MPDCKVRRGDSAAFERLVAGYRAELFAHCYRTLGSVQDAEDDAIRSALALNLDLVSPSGAIAPICSLGDDSLDRRIARKPVVRQAEVGGLQDDLHSQDGWATERSI